MNAELKPLIEYMEHVGGSIEAKKFDEDWEPVGPQLRFRLCDAGHCREEEGVLFLKGYGSILAEGGR